MNNKDFFRNFKSKYLSDQEQSDGETPDFRKKAIPAPLSPPSDNELFERPFDRMVEKEKITKVDKEDRYIVDRPESTDSPEEKRYYANGDVYEGKWDTLFGKGFVKGIVTLSDGAVIRYDREVDGEAFLSDQKNRSIIKNTNDYITVSRNPLLSSNETLFTAFSNTNDYSNLLRKDPEEILDAIYCLYHSVIIQGEKCIDYDPDSFTYCRNSFKPVAYKKKSKKEINERYLAPEVMLENRLPKNKIASFGLFLLVYFIITGRSIYDDIKSDPNFAKDAFESSLNGDYSLAKKWTKRIKTAWDKLIEHVSSLERDNRIDIGTSRVFFNLSVMGIHCMKIESEKEGENVDPYYIIISMLSYPAIIQVKFIDVTEFSEQQEFSSRRIKAIETSVVSPLNKVYPADYEIKGEDGYSYHMDPVLAKDLSILARPGKHKYEIFVWRDDSNAF